MSLASFCEFVATCPIYEGMSQREKNTLGARFCLGEFTECARYRLAKEKGRSAVPPDLMPDGSRKGEGSS